MKRLLTTILFGLATGLAGCASIDAVRVTDSEERPAYTDGIPYQLGFTQFKITATQRLSNCGASPVIRTSIVAVPSIKSDPGQFYRLEHKTSFLKRMEMEVNYHDNGNLASFNGEIEDKTAEFAGNVIKAGVGIASVPLKWISNIPEGGGEKEGADPLPAPNELCTREIIKLLASLDGLKNQVKNDTEALADASHALAEEARVYKLIGKEANRSDVSNLLTAANAVAAKKAALKLSTKTLEESLASLTVTRTHHWPENGNQASASELFPALKVTSKTDGGTIDGKPRTVGSWFASPIGADNAGAINPVLAAQTGLSATIVAESPVSRPTEKVASADGKSSQWIFSSDASGSHSGLKYRVPTMATLKIVSGPEDTEIVFNKTFNMLQVGQIHVLKLSSVLFSHNTAEIDLDKTGRPTRVKLMRKSSADKAGTLLASAADQYLALETAKIEAEKATRDAIKTDLEKLEESIAMLEAEDKLTSLIAGSQVKDVEEETAVVSAGNALLQAELTRIQTEAAIAEALAAQE